MTSKSKSKISRPIGIAPLLVIALVLAGIAGGAYFVLTPDKPDLGAVSRAVFNFLIGRTVVTDGFPTATYVFVSDEGVKIAQSDGTGSAPPDEAAVPTTPPVTGVSTPVAASSQASVAVTFNGSTASYIAESPQTAQLIAQTINSNPYQVTDPSGYSAEYREEMSELKSSGRVLIDIPAIRPDTAEILKAKYGPNLENYPSEDGRTQLLDAIERGRSSQALAFLDWLVGRGQVIWVVA